jgi:membrane fusion protein (multidrug efflux system)
MESNAAPARRPESAPPAPRRDKKPFLILGGLVLLFGVVTGVYLLATANQEATDDAQVEADVVPIAARVNGQVAKRLIEDNQRVKKGDLVIQIDDADFAARVKQADGELETARAQAAAADAQVQVVEASAKGGLQTARASFSGSSMGVANAEAQLAAARAGLERAKAEAHKGEMDLQRTKQLVAGNAQVAYDASQAALAQAQAQVAASAEMRRLAGTRVGEARGRLDQSTPIVAQIAAAQANAQLAHGRIKVAEASLELAKLQLSYTKVVASEDGLVTKMSVQAGQMIQVGQPLAELVPDRTYVVANFKETQVGRLRPGQTARVRIDAFAGVDIEGRLESIAGGTGARFSLLPPDNASGNFVKVVQRVPVRIAWTKRPDLPLQAGLSADVTVYVRKEN